jgi:glutamate synthase (NADPH/NADH) small chain
VEPIKVTRETGRSVGIIGAGPAGLAAADMLRRQGHAVTVYDRYDRSGGLLMYGIPNFKLDKKVVTRRDQLLRDGGIAFELNTDVGQSVTLHALRARHDAMLIATGVYQSRILTIAGSELGNIVPAIAYLTTSNRKGMGDAVPHFDSGALNAAGKRVVVIGGGDTAMDCVRTAVRQGAKSVKCLYRRDRDNMPGSQREVSNAIEEGVEFLWMSAPEAVLHDGETTATGVRAVRMRLGTPDMSGRAKPEEIPGSQFVVPADMVIEALGFDPEDVPVLFNEPALGVTRWGTLKTDHRTMQTTMDGVFAAGDIVRGASLVVWAIRDGRDAAAQIHSYIEAKATRTPAHLKKAS